MCNPRFLAQSGRRCVKPMPTITRHTAWPIQPIIHHDANTTSGRDLVIGDLHGYFDTLEQALDIHPWGPGQCAPLAASGNLSQETGPVAASARIVSQEA